MHEHVWTEMAAVTEGHSTDSYYSCSCGWILHVYTYPPGNIRHENGPFEPASWTAAYAHGLARGLRR